MDFHEVSGDDGGGALVAAFAEDEDFADAAGGRVVAREVRGDERRGVWEERDQVVGGGEVDQVVFDFEVGSGAVEGVGHEFVGEGEGLVADAEEEGDGGVGGREGGVVGRGGGGRGEGDVVLFAFEEGFVFAGGHGSEVEVGEDHLGLAAALVSPFKHGILGDEVVEVDGGEEVGGAKSIESDFG